MNFVFLLFLQSTNSECMVLGCLASWAVNVLFQWDALPFYLVHILVWFLSDWIMLSVVQVRTDECRFTSDIEVFPSNRFFLPFFYEHVFLRTYR